MSDSTRPAVHEAMPESQVLPVPSRISKRPVASALFGYIPHRPGILEPNAPKGSQPAGGSSQPPVPPLQDDKYSMSLRLLHMQAQASFETYSTKQDALMSTLSDNIKEVTAMKQLFDRRDDELHAHITATANRTQTEIIKSTKACQESVSSQLNSIQLHHTEQLKDTKVQATALTSMNERLHSLQSHLTQLHQSQHTQFSQIIHAQQTQLTELYRSHNDYVKGLDTLKAQVMQENRTTVREVLSTEMETLRKSLRDDLSDMVSRLTRDAMKACGDEVLRELNQQIAAGVSLATQTQRAHNSCTSSPSSRARLAKRLFPTDQTNLERSSKRPRRSSSTIPSHRIFGFPTRDDQGSRITASLTGQDGDGLSPIAKPSIQHTRSMATFEPLSPQAASGNHPTTTNASATCTPEQQTALNAQHGVSDSPYPVGGDASPYPLTDAMDQAAVSRKGTMLQTSGLIGVSTMAASGITVPQEPSDPMNTAKVTTVRDPLTLTQDSYPPRSASTREEILSSPFCPFPRKKRTRTSDSEPANDQPSIEPESGIPVQQNAAASIHTGSSSDNLVTRLPSRLDARSTLKDHFAVTKRGSTESRGGATHLVGSSMSAPELESLAGPAKSGHVKPKMAARGGRNKRVIHLPSESQEEEEEEEEED